MKKLIELAKKKNYELEIKAYSCSFTIYIMSDFGPIWMKSSSDLDILIGNTTDKLNSLETKKLLEI